MPLAANICKQIIFGLLLDSGKIAAIICVFHEMLVVFKIGLSDLGTLCIMFPVFEV